MAFIGNSRLNSAVQSAQERSDRTQKAPILSPGVYKGTLVGVELRKSEKTGRTHMDIEFAEESGMFRTIKESYGILPAKGEESPEFMEINLRVIAGIFLDGFDHQIRDGENAADFIKQFSQFKGKTCYIVVNHRQRLYTKEMPRSITIFNEPHIWYTGNIERDPPNFNIAEATRPLSADEQAVWNTFKGEKKIGKGVNVDLGTTAVSVKVGQKAPPVKVEAEKDDTTEVEGDLNFG